VNQPTLPQSYTAEPQQANSVTTIDGYTFRGFDVWGEGRKSEWREPRATWTRKPASDEEGERWTIYVCENCGKPDQEHGDMCVCEGSKRLRTVKVQPAFDEDRHG
jgi:hypothetical protein